uniref:Uncharacterized protein n=1 Tax=Meloidogyne javanica TaxID=6303 RepID=A0A915M788_MELJA
MQKRYKEEFINVFRMMLSKKEQSIASDLKEIFNLIEDSIKDLEDSSLIISQISYWALTTFVVNALLSLNLNEKKALTKEFGIEIIESTSILLSILQKSNISELNAIIKVSLDVSYSLKNIFALNEDFIDGGIKIIYNKEIDDYNN